MSGWIPLSGQFQTPLNTYIRHYEGLSYDTEALHNSHQRAKRALSPQDKTVQLDFHAHGRSVSAENTRTHAHTHNILHAILYVKHISLLRNNVKNHYFVICLILCPVTCCVLFIMFSHDLVTTVLYILHAGGGVLFHAPLCIRQKHI